MVSWASMSALRLAYGNNGDVRSAWEENASTMGDRVSMRARNSGPEPLLVSVPTALCKKSTANDECADSEVCPLGISALLTL